MAEPHSVRFVPTFTAECPTHGRVQVEYRVDCCWWECPQMVDCGFTVTREDVVNHPDGPADEVQGDAPRGHRPTVGTS